MAFEMIQNIPKGSITDVKKSPMDIFKKSKEVNQGVYILNRNDVAGVMLDKELYEDLLVKIEELTDKLFEAEAARRIALYDSREHPVTYSLEEVMGEKLANMTFDADEDDGWE